MGPWLGLANFLGHELGKGIGKIISKDISAVKAITGFSHARRISDLTVDSGVSASYLKTIAEESHTVTDLKAIKAYLYDVGKTANLNSSVKDNLIRIVKEKIELLEDQAALKELIRVVKENGIDHLL